MAYEDIQVVTQLASLAIFLSITVAAYFYAFRKSNKAKFAEAAEIPFRDEMPQADGETQ